MSLARIPQASDWRRRLDGTHRVLEGIRESRSSKDVCNWVLDYACQFEATNLLAGTIPPPCTSRREQLSHVLLDAWPEEWARRYFSNAYLYRDPTIRLARQANPPFRWSQVSDLCNTCPLGRRIMEEAGEFGLREGLTITFSTVERYPVGFSIGIEQDLITLVVRDVAQ